MACYQGPPRFNERDRAIDLGCGKTIFVAHTSDLFAGGVAPEHVLAVLLRCQKYRFNEYVFQTKNPMRAACCLSEMPDRFIFGTTIETDDWKLLESLSKAPHPYERSRGIDNIRLWKGCSKVFITIEPIMKFSGSFARSLMGTHPRFINIGADSKHCNLPEPTAEETINLITDLRSVGIEVRLKSNLSRIIGEEEFRKLSEPMEAK
jgi:hypothetical protein